jgi:putative intracellular protease/amidase
VDAPGRQAAAHLLAGRTTVLAWLKNLDHEYYQPDREPVAGGTFVVPLRGGGTWWGKWIDPWTGAVVAKPTIVAAPGEQAATLAVPAFSRDLALRLERAP